MIWIYWGSESKADPSGGGRGYSLVLSRGRGYPLTLSFAKNTSSSLPIKKIFKGYIVKKFLYLCWDQFFFFIFKFFWFFIFYPVHRSSSWKHSAQQLVLLLHWEPIGVKSGTNVLIHKPEVQTGCLFGFDPQKNCSQCLTSQRYDVELTYLSNGQSRSDVFMNIALSGDLCTQIGGKLCYGLSTKNLTLLYSL